MLCIRQVALRVLSSSPSLPIKSRSITRLAAPISRVNTQRTTSLPLQRRWASEEAATQQEPEADGAREAQHATETTTSSTLENATDSVKEHASAAASQVSDAAQSATATATGAAQSLGAAAGFGSPRNSENPGGQRGNAPALDGEPSATVYVGNLYFDVRSEDLKKEFERAGPIDEAKVIMDHRGLSKGFGYVRFQDIASATKAIELYNLQNFEGRRLSVQYSIYRGRPTHGQGRSTDSYDSRTLTERPQNPPTKTLFIGNMSFDMSDRDLNDLFRGVKDVIDVRVAIDRRTGQPRGFAHADFVDVKSATDAAEYLKGKVVCGRPLRIDFSTSSGRAVLPTPGPDAA